MAITPRTIFSSAAPATVAAVSLLAFTAVGTVAYMSMQDCPTQTQRHHASAFHQVADGNPCSSIRKMQGANKADWSEREWVRYSLCFEQTRDSKRAAQVAGQGLKYHGDSSMLYSIKGYHEIVLDQHSEAVSTLKKGLRNASSPNGVLENNLAWAGTWAPRELKLDRAKKLYKTALDKTSNSCAFLHTGLWVEYAAAQRDDGVGRYQALRSFDKLRSRYEGCAQRLEHGDWKDTVELAGAAVLFAELDDSQPRGTKATEHANSGEKLVQKVANKLNDDFPGVSVDAVCAEAMPMSSTHHLCEKRLGAELRAADQPVIEAANDATDKQDEPCPV
jgi:tetratricopeptide (TPR) repeat protein